MKHATLTLIMMLLMGTAYAQFDVLVWQDEFDGTGLPDSTKWTHETGGGGWGNQELQYYTGGRTENARQEDGKLIIEARKESYQGSDYTSARLITKNKGDWTYGRIELKAKLPAGRGSWPAIWMLPTEWIYGNNSWPDVGEIDVMEHVGYDEGVIHGTIHTHDFNHMNNTEQSGHTTVADATSAFHVYAIEWTEDKIKWFVDDLNYYTYYNNGDGWSAWPFDHPFHLLLNIAVGGTWGGAEGVDDTIFPIQMEFDYVRVYKKDGSLNDIIDGPTEVVPQGAGVKFSSQVLNAESLEWEVPEDAELITKKNTNNILVNWGCQPGDIILTATVNGQAITDTLSVGIKENAIQGDLFWNDNGTPLQFHVDPQHQTTYTWEVPASATISSGQNSPGLTVDWGTTGGTVGLTIENACGTSELSRPVLDPSGQYPYPDPLKPHSLPGTIESIHYDYGGEGIAYHDNDPQNTGGGPRPDESVDTEYKTGAGNVGWFETGEWMEYTVKVDKTVFVEANFQVASLDGGGPVEIFLDGEKMAEADVGPTGGWGEFSNLTAGSFAVTEDASVLRIQAGGGGFNIAQLEFKEAGATGVLAHPSQTALQLYPNPVSEYLIIKSEKNIKHIIIHNTSGQVVHESNYANREKPTSLSLHTLPKGIYFLQAITPNQKIYSAKFSKF